MGGRAALTLMMTVGVCAAFSLQPVHGQPTPPQSPSVGRELRFDDGRWDRTNGESINLGQMELVWADEFDSFSILPGGASGATRWYAGAQGGPYGAANVDENVRTNVYRVADGVLTIEATADTGADGSRLGSWLSGHLQTVNKKGEGFALRQGYFEARMKLPHSRGAWPGFWLKHRSKWLDPNALNVELDVLEWYGGDWGGLHHTVHVGIGPNRKYKSDYENRNPTDVSQDWHTHGVLITSDSITIYFDGVRVARFPMVAEFKDVEWYPQLTLAVQKDLDTGVVAPEAISPMDLQVDYVRAYRQVGQ